MYMSATGRRADRATDPGWPLIPGRSLLVVVGCAVNATTRININGLLRRLRHVAADTAWPGIGAAFSPCYGPHKLTHSDARRSIGACLNGLFRFQAANWNTRSWRRCGSLKAHRLPRFMRAWENRAGSSTRQPRRY